MKIEERERACLELLKKLPEGYVLIGGYAVSAFEFPRFSVDLDIVIAEKEKRGQANYTYFPWDLFLTFMLR